MATPSVWTFTDNDILATAPLASNASADVPTCIVAEGSRVTLGEGDGGGVVTTPPTVVEISAPYALKGASFFQFTFESALVPLTNPGDKPTETQVIRRVVTTTTKQNGCTIRTQVDTFEPRRREAARYRQLDFGGRFAVEGVYVDADGTVEGPEKAWADRYERLQLVQRVVTVPFYTGPLGELELTEVRTARFFNPGAALFFQATPFTTPTRLNLFTLGSGAGVELAEEIFFDGPQDPRVDISSGVLPLDRVWFQLDTVDRLHDEGYEIEKAEAPVSFARTDTGDFLYDEAGSKRSTFAEVRPIITAGKNTIRSAIPGEEGSHSRIVTDSARGITTKITAETLGSFLPAVPVCELEIALRQSSAPITAIVCAGESTRRPVVQIIADPWAQTVDEARARATQELRELQAIEVSCAIPPNAVLLAGDPVTLHVPRRGWVEQPCWIDTISQGQEARAESEAAGPITGSVVLKVATL